MQQWKKVSHLSILLAAALASANSSAMEKTNKDMTTVLDKLAAKGGKPIETLSAEEARKQPTPTDAVKDVMASKHRKPLTGNVATEDIQVDGAAGPIPARVYRPKNESSNAQNRPLIVYYHGGGFVIASNDVYDATPRALASQTGATVLSVEYRKAPEFKFPAAHDDAFAAYQWALKNAIKLGIDPGRVAVAGESAGGNLALNTAIKARDTGIAIPKAELLVYPVAGIDMNTESYRANADAKPLNKPMMAWFVQNYLRSDADKTDPRMDLIEKGNFKGLKPATIITAEVDPLRSDGKGLAEAMKKQGVDVTYKNYEGVTHEFFGMADVVGEAKSAQKLASKELANALK